VAAAGQAGDERAVAVAAATDEAGASRSLLTFPGSVVAGNRGLQPTGNITSLVRRDVIARCGPNLLAMLNSVPAMLGTGTLRALGARVELAGQDSRLVAGGWLRAHGLIPAGGDLR
jgi:glycine betaine/choline ABC-type transport system substrate-binding protein